MSDLELTARTAYPAVTPGARVRIVEMGEHLTTKGVRIRFWPSLSDAEYLAATAPGDSVGKTLALARGFVRASRPGPKHGLKLVYRLRFLLPSPLDLLDLLDRIDVYDFDDAIYLAGGGGPAVKREAQRAVYHLRNARLVLAGNRILASAAMQYADRVEIVPSCIDPLIEPVRVHRDAEVVTIGWTGSRTTGPYLYNILPAIHRTVATGAKLRVIAMGVHGGPQAPWIEYRPWTLAAERRLLQEIDIGIMPLPDNAWTRGKCGYKLLRYFAAGLPTVASPVGVNADIVSDDRGIAATNSSNWSAALADLARDVAGRTEMGARARRYVEREYSFQTWAPRVANSLKELAGC